MPRLAEGATARESENSCAPAAGRSRMRKAKLSTLLSEWNRKNLGYIIFVSRFIMKVRV